MTLNKFGSYAFGVALCVFCLFVADVVIGSLAPHLVLFSDAASVLSLFFCVVCFVVGIVCREQAAKTS